MIFFFTECHLPPFSRATSSDCLAMFTGLNHPHSLPITLVRKTFQFESRFPSTTTLWKILLHGRFLREYNLNIFKTRVSRYLFAIPSTFLPLRFLSQPRSVTVVGEIQWIQTTHHCVATVRQGVKKWNIYTKRIRVSHLNCCLCKKKNMDDVEEKQYPQKPDKVIENDQVSIMRGFNIQGQRN